MTSQLKNKSTITMSKPVSFAIQNYRALNTTVRQNMTLSNTIFTTDNKLANILRQNTALRFKSGGWQEDTKKWGLLWTLEGKNRTKPMLDMCVKQKLVKVTTNSGEKVMAITINTDSCTL